MSTPINGFDLPVNNADFDTWGTKLNTVLTAIDTLLGSPANTIKGNNTGSLAPTDNLTTAQVSAMLPAMVGDSGAGGTKGLVPAPAAGDAAAGKFLNAAGTWAALSSFIKKIGQFNGSTGATVFASGMSVVRTGTGVYDVTLSPAMANTNYAISVYAESTSTGFVPTIASKATTGFFVQLTKPGVSPGTYDLYDAAFLNVEIKTL